MKRWAYGLTVTLAVFSCPAVALPVCAQRDQLVTMLAERFRETQIGFGQLWDGRLFELYAHADGRTWTQLIIRPDGKACIAATGENWTHSRGA